MDDSLRQALILIPALPLAAAVLVALLGAKVLRNYSHWPIIFALAGSFVCSLAVLSDVMSASKAAGEGGFEQVTTLWTWADVGHAYDLKTSDPAVPASDAGWRNF